ncbi:MAG: sigma-54-dependent Fis family transcriptional regulator [bacterium]|nr:sigma-54-dependent Fis family transcriptional regulator [bacterium]
MADKGRFFNRTDHIEAKHNLKKRLLLKKILGTSRSILNLHRKIVKISSCDISVLITGESGTGKELVARTLHYLSPRGSHPFIAVNCGAIPESLFENELFGHVKGAFTDAGFHQKGLVREAESGSLFLDEVGMITAYCQVKLLRLLQDGEYKPLGDSKPHTADIRIIAATNDDLEIMVNEKKFREDLFYRLNIVSIVVPPLRDRREDIPILADHFLKKYARIYKKPIHSISAEAMKKLLLYPWPGNIRQLENVLQQSLVMASGPVIAPMDIQVPRQNDLPETEDFKKFKDAKKECINRFERTYLEKLLTDSKGDMQGAAARSGKSRTALWNLLAKYKLHPSSFSNK